MSATMEKRVEVRATADEVWSAISTGEGLVRWFAPEARVKPGVGGEVYMAWGGEGGASRIQAWEPGRRLVHVDSVGEPPGTIDYRVEPGPGGTTALRILQTGFAPGSDMEASLDRGWDMLLGNLRVALERGRGLPCAFGFASARAGKAEDAWARLLGPGVLAQRGTLAPRARVSLAPGGEAIEAEVDLWRPGIAFAVERLDRPERIGFTFEPSGLVYAYRLAWGLSPEAAEGMKAAWAALFARQA